MWGLTWRHWCLLCEMADEIPGIRKSLFYSLWFAENPSWAVLAVAAICSMQFLHGSNNCFQQLFYQGCMWLKTIIRSTKAMPAMVSKISSLARAKFHYHKWYSWVFFPTCVIQIGWRLLPWTWLVWKVHTRIQSFSILGCPSCSIMTERISFGWPVC